MSNDIDALLIERGATHGNYDDHARITQRLKNVIDDELRHRSLRCQECLSSGAIEALDMISHKIGRIIAGQWDFPDHWEDIAGYALLPVRKIEGKS